MYVLLLKFTLSNITYGLKKSYLTNEQIFNRQYRVDLSKLMFAKVELFFLSWFLVSLAPGVYLYTSCLNEQLLDLGIGKKHID